MEVGADDTHTLEEAGAAGDSSTAKEKGGENGTSTAATEEKQQKESITFKKGHRRAHSMPSNAHRAAAAKEQTANAKHDNSHKRKVIRHRHVKIPINMTNGVPGARVNVNNRQLNFDEIEVLEEDDDFEVPISEEEMMRFPGIKHDGNECERHSVHKRFWQLNWKRVHFTGLPTWLQDNEFLHRGHRPQLSSFGSCFKSIFSLHTETGNIWTHMYGCVAFIGIATWFLIQPSQVVPWPDKLIFSAFFVGAILCMGLSFAFHTVQCHSENVGRLFSKLDYAGISLLIIGSFVPWLYYTFYCRALPMAIYISMIVILGIAALVVSLFDKFAQPKFRPIRAGVFMAMGLSSVLPALHIAITDGFKWMFHKASLHWLLLMGALYLIGATIYMLRFPERCCPGKFDLFCQSHQLFHLFVVIAATVHYHGILELAMKRLEDGSCSEQLIAQMGDDHADWQWLEDRIRPY